MKRKVMASCLALTATIVSSFPVDCFAGFGAVQVQDASNLQQNITAATEAVAQTAKQISQYQTQLQQYKNQLKNTMAPADNIWNQAQSTIQNLLNATNTLGYYKSQLGNLDAYLNKYQDLNHYESSPCYSTGHCTETQLQELNSNRQLQSQAQKKANDAMVQGINQQLSQLQTDANKLQELQASAKGADGQLAAIGYANQIASNASFQLLQLRTLMLAQQNAQAARWQADADRQAQQEAADKEALSGKFVKSSDEEW